MKKLTIHRYQKLLTNRSDLKNQKKRKKNFRFDDVTVYYFPRSQGFVSVPSQGTITLGMVREHSYVEQYSISDFSRHRHALHKSILRERKLLPASTIESDDNDDDERLPVDDYYFVQPIATRQRRLLLKQAGLVKVDTSEKQELTMIRRSRETCGCSCRRDTGGCQPTSCECYLNGIACQVDRLTFPCPCATMLCRNPLGRLEFNQNRVRNHFIRTISRLEAEKQQQQDGCVASLDDDCSTIASLLSSMISSIELEQREISSLLRSLVASIDPPMMVVVVSPPPTPPSQITVVNVLTPPKEPLTRVRRSCRTPSPASSRSSLRRKATSPRSSSTSIISAKSA